MIKLGIIGLGQQALRTHVPCINLARSAGADVQIAAVADFPDQLRAGLTADPASFAGTRPVPVDRVRAATFGDDEARRVVDEFLAVGVNAVIVATEPVSHFGYLKALEVADIVYLIDKPFLCRRGISLDPAQADAAIDDLRWLQDRAGCSNGSVNITRRFDPALRSIRRALDEAERRTGQVVTHVGALYSDGEHRDAAGCRQQEQHPFHHGYGALNHSGYHVVDTAVWLAGVDGDPGPVVISVCAQSRSVEQFLAPTAGDQALDQAVGSVEYDSVVNVSISRSSGETTLLSLAIIHDSCSNRRWQQPRDLDERLHLGRLSHELTTAAQGEVQNAMVRMVELPHPEITTASHALPVRVFRADVTRNPLYANQCGLPVFEDLSPEPLTQRSLAASSKFKAIRSFLAKASGEPHDPAIDIDRHIVSQLTLLLAARSLARGGTVESEKVGAHASR